MFPMIFVYGGAVVLLSLFGGGALLANPWFGLVVVMAFAALIAGAFGHRRHGNIREPGSLLETHGNVAVTAAVYAGLLYIPVGFIPDFWKLSGLRPHAFVLLTWSLLFLFALIPGRRLPPAAAFPWGPLCAVAGWGLRWGFTFIEQMKSGALPAFPGTPPWWAEAFYLGLSVLVGIDLTLFVLMVLVIMMKLGDRGLWLHVIPTDGCALAFQRGSGLDRFVISSITPPVQFPTPEAVIAEARRLHDPGVIEEWQLGQVLVPSPDVDTANWDSEDWDNHYGGRNFPEWVQAHLDPLAFGDPNCWALPKYCMPGFPGFITPYSECEPGLEVEVKGVKLPLHYLNLRPSGPYKVRSEEVDVEGGFRVTLEASYRTIPALLSRVMRTQNRDALIKDLISHTLGQIAMEVGPWVLSFVGEPLARGGLQRGLVVPQPARGATPYTRQTSMLAPKAVADAAVAIPPIPQLVDANRPAFLLVIGFMYDLFLRVLLETGMWIIPRTFQLDDVDAPEDVRYLLLQATKAIVASTVTPELRLLTMVASEAGMAGVARGIQDLGLSNEQRAAILAEAAKLLHVSGGVGIDNLLIMAGKNAGVAFRTGGGEKK